MSKQTTKKAPVQQAPNMAEIMADYYKTIAFFSQTPAEVWETLEQKTAMTVFEKACTETKAYKKFLSTHHINAKNIKSIEDFSKLPIIDKDNYVKKYGFEAINSVRPGHNLYSFSMSSGTTDKPTIWPRYYSQEEGYIKIFDTFMRLYWNIDKKKTLAINAFNLGVYASGIAVNVALRPLTQKYKMTVSTTGSDLDNIVETIKQLSSYYDQTVIFSYPTFSRTILDRLEEAKINLKKLNLKLFIAGEGSAVEWGSYINEVISGDKGSLTTIIDGYGTTDLGLLGVGSALTNLIRNLTSQDKDLRYDLFGKTEVVPNLFQYATNNYYLEQIGNEICFTSCSATPLVRYNLHDRGGVIKFRKMESVLAKHGYDYKKLIKSQNLPEEIIWQHPFVYCFGRRDDTVIIGGGNVFPEQIAPAVINSKAQEIHSFKLGMKTDDHQHQMMTVTLELKESISCNEKKLKVLAKKYHDIILEHLMRISSDYAIAYRSDPKYCDPIIEVFNFATGPFLKDLEKTKPKLLIC